MIIGTAGHIDHGKTTLVRALTGVDTDRLKEEKTRGISIELGYAYVPVPGTTDILGFIDVPGHEKFIHTMAAGAVGIDHVLLVIAADDGVMPQTREHLAITLLMGVTQGTVALTKADRVDAGQLAAVQADIAALLAGTPLAEATIFPTHASAVADPGTAALRQHLLALARNFPGRTSQGLFRLAVDRAFTLLGQGTTVTGTVFGGSVRVGDSVQHSGSGALVRVRSLHAQNQASDIGVAGQRVALNLAGIDKDAIRRGDWIAEPLALQATRRLDVRLRVLASDGSGQQGQQDRHKHASQSARNGASPVTQWTSVHLHLGTSRHLAHVVPLQGEHIAAGAEAYAQLVLEDDLYVTAGDHFILRNAQATHTIAGGTVLDPYAPERKRRSAGRLQYLNAVQATLAQGEPGPLIRQSPWGISRAHLARLLGRPLHALPVPAGCVALGKSGPEQILLAEDHWQGLLARVLEALQRFHERTPDEPGVNAARLRRMGLPGLGQDKYDTLWQGLLASLIEHGQLIQTGPWLHAPGHSVQLSTEEEQQAEMLLPDIADGRFDPPWVRDLANNHGLPEERVRALLRKLARQGRLCQIVKDLFYHPDAVAAMQAIATELAQQSADQAVKAKDFRDATALGRKRAVQVLEYFDRSGFTRRVRDGHALRG